MVIGQGVNLDETATSCLLPDSNGPVIFPFYLFMYSNQMSCVKLC